MVGAVARFARQRAFTEGRGPSVPSATAPWGSSFPHSAQKGEETLCFFCANRRPLHTIPALYRVSFGIECSPS